MAGLDQLSSLPVDSDVVRIALAGALGLFLGLEREWSHKSAGIRTFSLIALLGAVFTILDERVLLLLGGVLVIAQSVLLATEGLLDEEAGLSLTTSVSMLVAYGVGALVAAGFILEAVTVTVLSSLLLVLKRELHRFAWGLTREELRSASEFAILAFVIFPLLPAEPLSVTVAETTLTLEPQIVWLMVVTVAGLGIVNYAVAQAYGGRGIVVTGFFGGLASSTAVVGAMRDHVGQQPAAASYAAGAILLANAAMAARNLVIAVAFTATRGVLIGAVAPLGAVILGSVAVVVATVDWREEVELKLETPFSLRNALVFGGLFLVVVVGGGLGEAVFGRAGLYLAMGLSGLVSSGGATTSAILLYRGGSIDAGATVVAVLIATGASVLVKVALTASSPQREFARTVAIWSAAVLGLAVVVTAAVTL